MTHRPKETGPAGRPPLPPQLLSIGDVADTLQVSDKTVRRWIERGEMPIHRVGRQIRISAADLATFVRARREG